MIIKINNLKLETIIGIYNWEKHTKQEIIINATIETNYEDSLISDNISDTIDYDSIINKIKETVLNERFNLIEGLISRIMSQVMLDERINGCELEIEKLMNKGEVKSCSIILKRTKDNG